MTYTKYDLGVMGTFQISPAEDTRTPEQIEARYTVNSERRREDWARFWYICDSAQEAQAVFRECDPYLRQLEGEARTLRNMTPNELVAHQVRQIGAYPPSSPEPAVIAAELQAKWAAEDRRRHRFNLVAIPIAVFVLLGLGYLLERAIFG